MPKETKARKSKKAAAPEKKKKGMLHLTHSHQSPSLTNDVDPNAPKRGLSAYMFFANENRDSVREENPGISFGTALLSAIYFCTTSADVSLQVKSAKSSATSGRPSATSSASLTTRRRRLINSVMRMRKRHTM